MSKFQNNLTLLPSDFKFLDRLVDYTSRDIIVGKALKRKYPKAEKITPPTTKLNAYWIIGAPYDIKLVMLDGPREVNKARLQLAQGYSQQEDIAIVSETKLPI